MRILCTNDDGIHADGLSVLEDIARTLSDDVWVVAPEEDQSGAARALTLRDPVRIRVAGEKKFAVAGTPTDCAQMGASHILPKDGKAPDLILSGVNNGQNIAEDVTLSGTIAAAFQGMQMGIPSVALSLSRFSRDNCRWDTPRAHAPGILKKIIAAGWPEDVVMNLNFPDCAPEDCGPVEVTEQGHRDQVNLYAEERMDLRGRTYYWYGFQGKLSNPPAGTDLKAIYEGRISLTPLHLSLTHQDARVALADIFS
ncbi:5'/3'-nucleotidase SurE [Parvularcula sp. IMCC14364]|uniref:5'/3'-nucleotidase SurE n=1 Tax=Parvularcula sp. IMCC14364 TaxID=3067902 RepID=UPI002741F4A1|nr:5'/3'-nucleotidase SurE [Parvularcula sp. IMCC14364]